MRAIRGWFTATILALWLFAGEIRLGEANVAAPVATVAQGALRGTVLKSYRGRTFFAFMGIPFAQPPTGELRFKPPRPADPWQGVLDANKEGSSCPQLHPFTEKYLGDEDCLFLNVYTPKVAVSRDEVGLPVMVWLHGGGFLIGSGSRNLYGPDFLLDEDIVLVTPNYRLGALGFLSMEDSSAPGNYGLKDQVLALKWVKESIAAFGGNPNSVTIFGQSSGGTEAHLHMVSPMSKGLFHKAISQSGISFAPWARTNEARARAEDFADVVGCYEDDATSAAMMQCLRKTNATELVEAVLTLQNLNPTNLLFFVPVVEPEVEEGEVFLPEQPLDLLRKGQFHDVPWITGVNTQDGIIGLALMRKIKNFLPLNEHFDQIAPRVAHYERDTKKSKQISERIRRFYFGDKAIGEDTKFKLIDLVTDVMYLTVAEQSLEVQAGKGSAPLYFYHLSAPGRTSFFEIMGLNDTAGVAHGDDIFYLFHSKVYKNDYNPTDLETKTTERMVKMWTNFAKTGNPTPEVTELLPITWKPFNSKEHFYLEIGKELTPGQNYKQDVLEFWKSIESLRQSNDL